MRRICILVMLLAAVLFTAGAETAMNGLFDAADQVAADTPRVLRGDGSLLLGGVAYNQLQVKLGDLFADLAANRLTGRNNFDADVVKQYASPQFPVGQASWILSGSLYDAGAGYLLILQLIDAEDGSQLKGWEFALGSEGIDDLMMPSALESVAAWDPYEPNDGPSSASFVEFPFRADGLSLADGDEDWFAFEVPALSGNSVMILEAATGGAMDTYMELYAPDDQSWPVAEDDDTDGGNAVINSPLPESGIWYVKVRGYSSEEEGDYSLTMDMSQDVFGPGEPDEGADRASRLNVGAVPLEKRMDYGNDEDWFRLTLVRPLGSEEVLRIETMSDMDLVMDLLDEYQGHIMNDDDSGQGNNAMIMVGGLDAGDYYVIVSSLDGVRDSYEIMANITVPARDAFEDDGSMVSASEISSDGRSQERSFSPIGDIDWVKFEVSREETYLMETMGNLDTYLELYDGDGSLMDENDDGDDYNAQIRRRLRPGTYYLKVTPYGTASPDEIYELAVTPLD